MFKIKIVFIICAFLLGCADLEKEKELASKNADVIAFADKYAGMHEETNNKELRELLRIDPAKIEWCAAFANAVLHSQGIDGSEANAENPYMARSFLTWGHEVEDPKPGDLIVFSRDNPLTGHVAFYVKTEEKYGTTYYTVIGGNQDDKVSYKSYRAITAISIRRQNL